MVTERELVIRIETEPSLRPDALAHATLRHIDPGPLVGWGYDAALWAVPERLTLLVLSSQLFADQQERLRFFQTVMAQGRAVMSRVWFKRSDGSLVPVAAEGVLAPEASGFFLRLQFRELEDEPGDPAPPPDRAPVDRPTPDRPAVPPAGPPVEARGESPIAPGREGADRRSAPGSATPGPVTPGPATPGPATPATPGPATPTTPPPSVVVAPELRRQVLDRLAIPEIGRTADRMVRFLDWIVHRRVPLFVSAPEGGGATYLIEAIHRARQPRGRVAVIDAELGVLSTAGASLEALASSSGDPSEGLLVRRIDAAPPAIQQQMIDLASKRIREPSTSSCLYATAHPGAPVLRRFAEEVGGDVFTVPALSERPQDIVPAMSHLLRRPRPGLRIFQTIQPEAAQLLQTYSWPGNVEEMREVAEAARLISGGAELRVEDLPASVRGGGVAAPRRSLPVGAQGRRGRPEKKLSPEEIRRALDASGGSRTAAARMLGVSRTTLWRKMTELGDKLLPSDASGEGGDREMDRE